MKKFERNTLIWIATVIMLGAFCIICPIEMLKPVFCILMLVDMLVGVDFL